MLLALMFLAATPGAAADWPPDLIVDQDFLDNSNELILVNDVVPGKIHMRLSNATPNIGMGRFYIFPDPTPKKDYGGPGADNLLQRVFRSDGGFFDRPAGPFDFDPFLGLMYVENWSNYRLRVAPAGGGVGPVLALGRKASFCLFDGSIYDSNHPQFDFDNRISRCDEGFQGISPGFEDVYSLNLPGQTIDITGIGPGTYWLESEVNPEVDSLRRYLEADYTNNVARTLITLEEGDFPVYPEGGLITASADLRYLQEGDWVRLFSPVESLGSSVYQWQKEGVNIEGEIGETLELQELTLADAALYTVIYENGSLFSSVPFFLPVAPGGTIPAQGLGGLLLCMAVVVFAGIARQKKKRPRIPGDRGLDWG